MPSVLLTLCILAATLLAAPSVYPDVPEPSVVDLTQLGGAIVDGHRTRIPVAASGDGPQIVQQPGTLDLFLEVPEQGELVFALPAGVTAEEFAVSATTEATSRTLACTRGEDGSWRASLHGLGGTPLRLRLENRRDKALSWTNPRVHGVSRSRPPVIDRAQSERPADARFNVLLYVVDTLRLDRMSVYGYERPTTPNLEKLVRRAILFRNAYAAGPHTIPSITALFASRLPSELSGRLVSGGAAQRTLAEAFKEAGYDTVALQANFLLQPVLGYARGFDDYRLLREETPEGTQPLPAKIVQEQAVAWMKQHRTGPFFMYIQTMDVHWPYDAPAPFGDMFQKAPTSKDCRDPRVLATLSPEDQRKRLEFCDHVDSLAPDERHKLERLLSISPNRYDGGVAYADHEIGRLLDEMRTLGLDERTIVVITSDHGEPLWQRGEVLHGLSLYEELVHVPLIIRLPWLSTPDRIDDIVSLMDLSPTLVDITGGTVPGSFLGHSLIRSRSGLVPQDAVGEQLAFRTNVPLSWYVREGPWKFITSEKQGQLFYLPSDPGEKHDVSTRHPVARGYLTTLLMGRSAAFRGEGTQPVPLDSGLSGARRRELENALKALGYVQ